jgi:hypothetical protein
MGSRVGVTRARGLSGGRVVDAGFPKDGAEMNRVVVAIIMLGALLGAAGCGKDSSSSPSATVSKLTLSPTIDYMMLKATEKFSLTATLSTGVTEAVTPTWSSDTQGVATVDSAGTVTGVGAGQATIIATYQGQTATELIRVIPNYEGTWSGTWAVTNCTVSGRFPSSWCNGVRGSFPATLKLLQAKDVVSGTWTLQEANGNVQGTVANDGTLNLTGSSLQSGVTIKISSWSTRTTDNISKAGTFVLTWTISGVSGSGQTTVSLQSFTKS